MPPPPPPGPPPPPAPGPGPRSQPAFKPKAGGNDRSALLKSIQNGAQLKKTVTNDRSAPIVGNVKNNSPANENSSRGGTGSSQTYGSNGSSNGPLPGIGGLFAGGMPTLKKTSGGVQTGRLSKLGQGEQNKVTNNFGNSRPLNSLSSSSSLNSSPSGVSPNKPPPPPSSNDKPRVPSPSPSSQSPRTKTIGPVHPASKPPPPPEPGHRPGNPPSRSSKSFSQARPSATIGPGPQSRTPLPMQQSVSRDDSSIQNGKLSNPPPPPVRTVSRAPPPPPTGKRPSQPPPPPPSGGRPPLRDLPPPPPPNHGQSMNGPPTPPTRRESIRKPETQTSSSESFELKFSGKFRSTQYLPPPELFSRCQKTYPSKTSA